MLPGPRNRPGGGPVETAEHPDGTTDKTRKIARTLPMTSPMATSFKPLAPELSAEEQRVFDWRFEQIRALAIDAREAKILAGSKVDLDLLRRIVAQGCPPDLAIRIVL